MCDLEVVADSRRRGPSSLDRVTSIWRQRRSHRPSNVVEDLHAEARMALIVSLVAFCCPPFLPAGLFLGWRVRNHARRAVPDLVEWVSLPYYVASAALWFGAAIGIIAIAVLTVCAHT